MEQVIGGIQTLNSIQGYLSFVIGVLTSALLFFAIVWKGLVVWYRIGKGLARRKIAIFAENEYESL